MPAQEEQSPVGDHEEVRYPVRLHQRFHQKRQAQGREKGNRKTAAGKGQGRRCAGRGDKGKQPRDGSLLHRLGDAQGAGRQDEDEKRNENPRRLAACRRESCGESGNGLAKGYQGGTDGQGCRTEYTEEYPEDMEVHKGNGMRTEYQLQPLAFEKQSQQVSFQVAPPGVAYSGHRPGSTPALARRLRWVYHARVNSIEITLESTRRSEMVDISEQVQSCLHEIGAADGICVVFVPHTTAGVGLNENADPDVAADIEAFLGRLIPRDAAFRHGEGNSDSHIKTLLCGSSECIPVQAGRLLLGVWQGVYLLEFDGPRRRTVRVTFIGS